jgi:hypothetical protein
MPGTGAEYNGNVCWIRTPDMHAGYVSRRHILCSGEDVFESEHRCRREEEVATIDIKLNTLFKKWKKEK